MQGSEYFFDASSRLPSLEGQDVFVQSISPGEIKKPLAPTPVEVSLAPTLVEVSISTHYADVSSSECWSRLDTRQTKVIETRHSNMLSVPTDDDDMLEYLLNLPDMGCNHRIRLIFRQ